MPDRSIAVCIIDENLSVPRDPRVWREALSLTRAGYRVSVICPTGRGSEGVRQTLDGVEIYRYPAYEASGRLDYVIEYGWALLWQFILAIRVYAVTRFRVIHASNPPDNIFLIAWFFRLFGVRFIFDQHDPAPELYAAKFGRKDFLYRLTRLAERFSYRAADAVIVTSESCRELALTRGEVAPDRVFLVRSCPDLEDFPLSEPRPELKRGRKHLVIYLGIMGSQDGVESLLQSIEYLLKERRRDDTLFVMIGPGPEQPRLKSLTASRGLEKDVIFTGGVYGAELLSYLCTADVAVAPDPCNEFNDKLTMIKLLEYQACGIPTVLYDLVEGRRCASDAALFARRDDAIHFGEQIANLLDSAPLRRQLGANGRKRIEGGLNWGVEQLTLLEAYKTALAGAAPAPQPEIENIAG